MPFSKENVSSNYVTVNAKKKKISMKKVKPMILAAARWGTFLTHQVHTQKHMKSMAIGLWKKNFPDEPVPNNLAKRLEELRDVQSGDTFNDIIGKQIMDDWANNDETHVVGCMISELDDEYSPEKLIELLSINSEVMRQHYNAAAESVAISRQKIN